MELTVESFWIVYIVALIVLAVILFAVSRKGGVKLSIGIFLAALLATVVTLMLIWCAFDTSGLSPSDEQTLWLLYCTMGVVLLLALFWMLFEVIGGSHRWKSKTSIKCNEDECEVTHHGMDHHRSASRERETLDVECDDFGCHVTGVTPAPPKESLNVRYLS